MSIYKKPPKTIIVNTPSAQLRLVTDTDGDEIVEAGEGDTAADSILLESLIRFKRSQLRLLNDSATVRILVTDYAAPVKEIATFSFIAAPATPATNVATFRLVYTAIDFTRAEYSGQPLENIFQISYLASATPTQLAVKLAATINSIPDLPVTATSTVGVVTITAKDFGTSFALYAGDLAVLGTFAVTTPPVAEVNGYEQLKNFQWSAPINSPTEFDRISEYMPIKGATYKSYYFETLVDMSFIGGHSVSDEQLLTVNKFKLYVNKSSASALITQLDLLVTQVNA